MIVVAHKKALLLNVSDRARITSLISTAREFDYKDHPLVAVPHGLDETRVLINMGFYSAPSPIRYYYDWPGQHTPFAAQVETAAFLTLNRNAFVLNDLGTGKTLAMLWAYDYMRSIKRFKRALVVTPVSTMERVWADEIFTNFPNMNANVLYGERSRRMKLLDQEADVYIINHDGIKVRGFVEAMAKRPDIDLIIIDELAQVGRTAGTDRWRALDKIVRKQHPRTTWGATGKPTPNAPTDAWAQCRLINPNMVPPYFNRFRDAVMRPVGSYSWVPRANNEDTVHAAMQPSIRFTRDQCVDLPECIYQTRSIEMSPEQSKAYNEMVRTLNAEMEDGSITAVNEAVKFGKLLQICCGAAYAMDGSVVDVPCQSRIDEVLSILEQAEGKVIIFVPFTGALDKLVQGLNKVLYPLDITQLAIGNIQRHEMHAVGVVDGSVPKGARDTIFKRFQEDPAMRVIVAQPGTMSHGLTLTAANTIVWYSAPMSNEMYEQANGRITRPGQKRTQFIVHLEAAPAERKQFTRLRNKQSMQGCLLDLIAEASPCV